jgi:hypothetical protein
MLLQTTHFCPVNPLRASLFSSLPRALPRGLLLDFMSFPVVILAGGLATRLRPLTEKIPESARRCCGRPFLEHQLDLLKRNSIVEVILCVSYLGEMIEQRYGDGAVFGVPIRCSFYGPILLGPVERSKEPQHFCSMLSLCFMGTQIGSPAGLAELDQLLSKRSSSQ